MCLCVLSSIHVSQCICGIQTLIKSFPAFHHVDIRDRTQVVRLSIQSHLPSSSSYVLTLGSRYYQNSHFTDEASKTQGDSHFVHL